MNKIGIQEIIKKVAFLDGTLRDLYLYNVSLEDWDRMIELVKEFYYLKSDHDVIPDSIKDIISIVDKEGFNLQILLNEDVSANCHFFISENETSPMEFDLDPRELQSISGIKNVLQFMRHLGDRFERDVFLTEENCKDMVLLSYSHSTKEHQCILPDGDVQKVMEEWSEKYRSGM